MSVCLSVRLSACHCDAVHCVQTIRLAAKVSEQVRYLIWQPNGYPKRGSAQFFSFFVVEIHYILSYSRLFNVDMDHIMVAVPSTDKADVRRNKASVQRLRF